MLDELQNAVKQLRANANIGIRPMGGDTPLSVMTVVLLLIWFLKTTYFILRITIPNLPLLRFLSMLYEPTTQGIISTLLYETLCVPFDGLRCK